MGACLNPYGVLKPNSKVKYAAHTLFLTKFIYYYII